MDAGFQLRQAREARALSLTDLSARTKIAPAILTAIEEGAFDRLPADIYLRGFVRAYAAEVGLPPADIVHRYLAERERSSHVLSAFESEATLLESGTDLTLPRSLPVDAFASEADDKADPAPVARRGTLLSALRVPLAAALLFAIGALLAISRMSGSLPPTLAVRPAADAPPAASATLPAESAESRTPVADDRRTGAAGIERPASPAPHAGSVAGEWTIMNRVRTTSYQAFQGLQLGYRLRLAQDGERVTGRGEKWSENGRPVPASRRTPIDVSGTFRNGRLELAFTERGTRRTSGGRFTWAMSEDGGLRGTFVSDAARSEGTSYARRAE